jgi:hypothetical protein
VSTLWQVWMARFADLTAEARTELADDAWRGFVAAIEAWVERETARQARGEAARMARGEVEP